MQRPPSEIYGCDTGNAFGFLSLVPREGGEAQPVFAPSETLNAKEGMPTAAYITPPDGTPIRVYDPKGGPALGLIRRNPACGVRAVKTRLWEDSLPLPGVERSVSPYEVYGAIVRDMIQLGNLNRLAERRSPIYDLVMTYPASLHNGANGLEVLNRMQKSIEDVVLDGHPLHVAARIPEPAAVGIDYLYCLQNQLPEDQRWQRAEFTALVYDLGHGTFDTAAVTARSQGEPYEVWASDGLPDVGGRNFDERLVEELTELLEREYGYQLQNAQEREQLLREAIEMKHTLSRHEEAAVQHQNLRDGSYLELSVTRARFEALTQDLLHETLEKTQEMISSQAAHGRTIDAIVLSGGASQMPMVKAALEAHLQPRLPVYLFRPQKAVSFGAARYALGVRPLPDMPPRPEPDPRPKPQPDPRPVAQLHTRHAYGVLVEEPGVLDSQVRILLAEGEPLPAWSEPLDFPVESGRIDVQVYRPEGAQTAGTLPAGDCENLVRLHFDVPRTERGRLTLTVDSGYDITARLELPDGTVQIRSTADSRKA